MHKVSHTDVGKIPKQKFKQNLTKRLTMAISTMRLEGTFLPKSCRRVSFKNKNHPLYMWRLKLEVQQDRTRRICCSAASLWWWRTRWWWCWQWLLRWWLLQYHCNNNLRYNETTGREGFVVHNKQLPCDDEFSFMVKVPCHKQLALQLSSNSLPPSLPPSLSPLRSLDHYHYQVYGVSGKYSNTSWNPPSCVSTTPVSFYWWIKDHHFISTFLIIIIIIVTTTPPSYVSTTPVSFYQ